VLGAVLATALGVAVYLYVAVWSYEQLAHRHVPANTNIALRADAAKILLFKPVREHLWPVLLESEGEDKNRRIQRIKDKTGVSIPVDLREVIIASVDAGAWVAIFGGNIEPGRFVAGLQEVLKEEGIEGWTLDGELLVHRLGAAIGQADDGVIVMGTNSDVTMAALPVGDEDRDLPVSSDGAISFMLNSRAYDGAIGLLPLTLPGLDTLSKIEQLSGNVMLSEEPLVELHVTPKPDVTADVLADDLDSSIMKLRLATLLMPHDLFGAKQAIGDTEVAVDGKLVRMTAPWPYAAIDKGVQQLAKILVSEQ
jgi:hypothetical protein